MTSQNSCQAVKLSPLQIQAIKSEIEKYLSSSKLCVECGNEFFHKPNCQRGLGLKIDEQNEIINICLERALSSNKKCCEICKGEALNTYWELYHQTVFDGEPALINWYYICDSCTPYAETDRPKGVIKQIIKSKFELKDLLKTIL